MPHAFEYGVAFDEHILTAPDGPGQTVAGTVPDHTQGWPFDLILRHAGGGVRPVMLDTEFGRARPAERDVSGGQGTARLTSYIVTVFGREVIRMHIARHEIDIRIV